jgi:hypothetical protein
MKGGVERQGPSPEAARPLGRVLVPTGASLVQAAMRRRSAERAFEDYVREMARRGNLPSQSDGPGAGGSLPKV